MNLPKDVAKFLDDYAPEPRLAESDLTVAVAATRWEMKYSGAQSRLKRMVYEGILRKEHRKSHDGKLVAIYIPVEPKK